MILGLDAQAESSLSHMRVKYHAAENGLVHLRERWGDDGSGRWGRLLAPFAAVIPKADSTAVSHRCNKLCLISPNVA